MDLIDIRATVSMIQFTDKDLDSGDLGGLISWTPPSDVSQVLKYNVYLATGSVGSGRSQISVSISAGSNQITLPTETSTLAFTHIVVYTASELVEQSTPDFLKFHDADSLPLNMSFVDLDLDDRQVGGEIKWTSNPENTEVTHHVVYCDESYKCVNVV